MFKKPTFIGFVNPSTTITTTTYYGGQRDTVQYINFNVILRTSQKLRVKKKIKQRI